jgi:hypothetical protein
MCDLSDGMRTLRTARDMRFSLREKFNFNLLLD